jgi:acetyl-CoA C-acetyltransferase
MGCALQQGATGGNVARQALVRAGLPVTVSGSTIDRQCSSGLQAIAVASRSIQLDGVPIAIGGGLESVSLVQNEHMNNFHRHDRWLMEHKARHLHADDRHGRGSRQALRHQPRGTGRLRA